MPLQTSSSVQLVSLSICPKQKRNTKAAAAARVIGLVTAVVKGAGLAPNAKQTASAGRVAEHPEHSGTPHGT
jgi:hypothetical protein